MTDSNPDGPRGSAGCGEPGRPRTILVADDDWLVADSLVLILKQGGYTARPVYSGEEAVEVAVEMCPDYLVSDVFMYRVSGVDAAREISRRFPSCKVILFSGHADAEELIDEFRRGGAAPEFLLKPFHPEVLLRRLRAEM